MNGYSRRFAAMVLNLGVVITLPAVASAQNVDRTPAFSNREIGNKEFKDVFDDLTKKFWQNERAQVPVDVCRVNPNLPQCMPLAQQPVDLCTINPNLPQCALLPGRGGAS